MLSKITCISIFIIVCFISSVDLVDPPVPRPIIKCSTDAEFITHVNESLNQRIAVVFLGYQDLFPAWPQTFFGDIVSKFLVIHRKQGPGLLTNTNKHFNTKNTKFPALYVVENGYELKERIWNYKLTEDKIITVAEQIRNGFAKKLTGKLVTDEIQALIDQELEAKCGNTTGSTSRNPTGSSAVQTARSTSVSAVGMPAVNTVGTTLSGQKRSLPFDLDLNNSPPREDNNRQRLESGGSVYTNIFYGAWGTTIDHTVGRRLSISPPANIGLSSGIPSNQFAATGSGGSGIPSKSPPAGPSGGGRSRSSSFG